MALWSFLCDLRGISQQNGVRAAYLTRSSLSLFGHQLINCDIDADKGSVECYIHEERFSTPARIYPCMSIFIVLIPIQYLSGWLCLEHYKARWSYLKIKARLRNLGRRNLGSLFNPQQLTSAQT